MLFRVLWTIDLLIAFGFLTFFVVGIQDGSVSSFNLGIWLVTLGVLGGVLVVSQRLRAAGADVWAGLLAATVAVPGVAAALFLGLIVLMNPRWN